MYVCTCRYIYLLFVSLLIVRVKLIVFNKLYYYFIMENDMVIKMWYLFIQKVAYKSSTSLSLNGSHLDINTSAL